MASTREFSFVSILRPANANGKKGRFGHGQVLLANGQLVLVSERGDVVLVEPTPQRFNEVTRFSALQQPKVWNPHALANGIVYVRNHEEMAAYDLRAQTD